LKDGNYQLVISAAAVTAAGLRLDGDEDGSAGSDYIFGANSIDGLYRKFGDASGDGTVDLSDFAIFRHVFGTSSEDVEFDESLDANEDGTIDLLDFARFRGNFGESR
jgi:hypothetical protein